MNLQLAGIHTPGSALSCGVPDPSWRFLGLAAVGVLPFAVLARHLVPSLTGVDLCAAVAGGGVLEALGLVWWWGR